MSYTEQVRNLPEGTLSKVLQSAHRIAREKLEADWGRKAEYAAYRVLYYDESTWRQALEDNDISLSGGTVDTQR
jgi:hypothetical protein